jgi:homocysteine S-methyltransferase
MYRQQLPQVSSSNVFLTDGGIETFLIFKKNLELQHFAAFPCLDNEEAKEFIKEYYTNYYQV